MKNDNSINNYKIQIYINIDGTDYSYTINTTGDSWTNFNTNKSVSLNYGQHTIKVKVGAYHFNWNGNSTSVKLQHITILNLNVMEDKTGKWNLMPNEQKNIGEKTSGTSFGKLNNNDLFIGFPSITDNIQTGDITPNNFVGYLKLGIYKIPYYL